MGASERFSLLIQSQTTGAAEVQKLQETFEKLQSAVDKTAGKTRQLGEGAKFEKFADGVKNFIQNPLQAAGDAVGGFLKTLGPMGTAVAGGAGVMALLAKTGYDAAHALAEYGVNIERTSIRTGLSAKEVSQFGFAMKRSGGDISSLETAMRMLSKGLADNSEEGKKAHEGLTQLGIKARDSQGNLRPMSQILLEISSGLSRVEGTANRNALAVKVLGRSALEALPDLLKLSEGVRRAKELGLGPSDQDIKRWEKYHEQIVEIETLWAKLGRKLKEPLAGLVILTVKTLREGGAAGATGKAGAWGVSAEQLALMGPSELARQQTEFGPTPLLPGPEWAAREAQQWRVDYAASQRVKAEQAASRDRFAGTKAGTEEAVKAARVKAESARETYLGYQGPENPYWAKLKAGVTEAEAALAKYEARLKSITDQATINTAILGLEAQANIALTKEVGGLHGELQKIDVEEAKFSAMHKMTADQTAKTADAFTKLRLAAVDADIKKFNEELLKTALALQEIDASMGREFLEKLHTLQTPWSRQRFDLTGASISDLPFGENAARLAAASGNRQAMLALSIRPGGEVKGARLEEAERLSIAKQLYDLSVLRIDRDLEGAERLHALDEARQHLQLAQDEASYGRQQRLGELYKRQMDEWRATLGSTFDAMLAGGEGLRGFATGFAKATGRMMFQNVGSLLLKPGMLSLPGQGTADQPNFLGKILQGTPFGLDPLKTATDMNTLATVQNTAAIRAMSFRASAGGGGTSNFSQYFEELGIPSGGWEDIGTGEGPSSLGLPAGTIQGLGEGTGEGGGGGAKATNLRKGVGYGMAGAAAGYGIYSGAKQGGTQGTLTAVSSGLGFAATIPGPQQPFIAAAAMITAAAAALMGDPRKKRDEALTAEAERRRFTEPSGADYVSDIYGSNLDYDYRGGVRVYKTVVINANIDTMDAGSFRDFARDNSTEFSSAVTDAISSGNAEDLVGTLRQVM